MDAYIVRESFDTAHRRMRAHRTVCDVCELVIELNNVTFPPCPDGMRVFRQYIKAAWIAQYYGVVIPFATFTEDDADMIQMVIFERAMLNQDWM